MTDGEIMQAIREDTPLNKARRVLSGEMAIFEQQAQQRHISAIECRRMEFNIVKKIAAELGVTL